MYMRKKIAFARFPHIFEKKKRVKKKV